MSSEESEIGLEREAVESMLERPRDVRTLLDTLPIAVFVAHDPECRRITGNRAAHEILRVPVGVNLSKSAPAGQEPLQFQLYRDGRELTPEELPVQRAARGEAIRDEEVRHVFEDGVVRNLLVSAAPLRDGAGRVRGAIATALDITDRKRVEAELRDSQRDLTDFFENANVGLHWVGPGGVILRANQAELDMLGYEREEYIGRHIRDFHADGPVIDDILARLLRGETLHDYPARLRCKDGSIRDVLINSSGAFQEGRFLHTRCFTRDVTERKQAEEALRESEARYRALIESQAEMLCRFRPDGTILFVNEAYARARETTVESLLGRNFWEFVAEEDRPAVRSMLERLTPEAPDVRIENRFETSGGPRWTLWTNRALAFDAEGRVTEAQSTGIDITDRVEAELALREREERYELVLAGAQAAIWDWDVPNGRVAFSPRWKELRGLADAEVSDREEEWSERIHPEDVERVMEAVRAHFEGNTPVFAAEYRVRHRDGHWVWILDRGLARRDAQGHVVRMAGSETDITVRKRAEEALRRRLVDLQTIYALSAKVARTAEIGEIVEAAMDGLIDAVGADRVSVLLFDDADVMRFRGWRGLSEEYRRRVDGHSQWTPRDVEARPLSIRDVEEDETLGELRGVILREGIRALSVIPLVSGGRLRGKFMVYYDLPHVFTDAELQLCETIAGHVAYSMERAQAQGALEENEERLRNAVDAADVGTWRVDLGTGLDTRDGSLNRILGLEAKETTQPVADFFSRLHPDDQGRADEAWRAALAGKDAYDLECRIVRPQGDVRWIRDRGRVVRDRTGAPLYATGAVADITDRRKAEEALREADRRKDEFLAILSHELRNPLAPLMNVLEIMKREEVDAGLPERVREVMERQLDHLVRLVDDLLDVSRISRGKIELRREQVDLGRVVRDAIETVHPLCERNEHELDVELPTTPVYVDADPVRLTQAVGNLLNNASKYTERGGRIELTVRVEDSHAVIGVRDDGIGIDPEQLPRIFDMFSQGEDPLRRSGSGLGIGLALVRSLVELHGGVVEARSAGLGRGSEFTVRLPLGDSGDSRSTRERSEAHGSPSVSRRILVVDDYRDAAETLAVLLEAGGHDVHVAFDGPEAVAAVAELRPDMVLLDLGLPKLGGYEVARRIRESEGEARTVLVALTGWGQEEDRRRTAEAGFDHHMVKPPDVRALLTLLADGSDVNGHDG